MGFFLFMVWLYAGEIMAINILALGDSYTVGTGVLPTQSWPFQLKTKLAQKSNPVDLRVIARNGWTSADLLQAVNAAQLTTDYDRVLILIGVNDQFQKRDASEYHANVTQIFKIAQRAAKNNPAHVLVLSIPDYGLTPFGQRFAPERITKELTEFNAIERMEAKTFGFSYLSISDLSREVATDRTLMAPDGLHYSGKMYARWVERIERMLQLP